MSTERGYTRINELVASLNAALLDMEQGRLGAQGLERTTEDARELFERLVVLRHKVREARAALSARTAEPRPAPVVVEPEALPPTPVRTETAERAPMRLDTRPDISARQTSLIDAIAEHDEPVAVAAKEKGQPQEVPQTQDKPKAQTQEASVKAAPAPAPAPVHTPAPTSAKGSSLAEKLEHAPIADLGKAITLSQKFLFVAELFAGKTADYDKAIATIDGHAGVAEARRFLDTDVLPNLKKAPDPEALSSFIDLVERRFK